MDEFTDLFKCLCVCGCVCEYFTTDDDDDLKLLNDEIQFKTNKMQ